MPDEIDKETNPQEIVPPEDDASTTLLGSEPETSESQDSPYQGKRSTGGYVPT